MNTSPDCVRCFFRQALDAAKLAGADEDQQHQVLEALSNAFPYYSFAITPAEMARKVYGLVGKVLNFDGDIYKELKNRSNEMALSLYDDLKKIVLNANDELLAATEIAIAGNIIDYGAKNELDIDGEIAKLRANIGDFYNSKNKGYFNYSNFKRSVTDSTNILYLGDNTGEILFDRVLIEEIKNYNPEVEVTYAVRAKPIINDVTKEDAYKCGIDKVARVVSSGSDAAGTVLSLCTDEFLNIFEEADIVISKGQGNFEALSDETKPIFFLFMIKCHVVADVIKGNVGDVILLFNKNKEG